MLLTLLLIISLLSSKTPEYLDLSDYSDLKLRVEEKAVEPIEPIEKPVIQTEAQTVSQAAVKTEKSVLTSPEELQSLFSQYGKQYGVNEQTLAKIAYCESTFNPQAVNGPYAGLYQFNTSTWASQRTAMGLNPDPNLRFNSEEAVRTTAFKISRDGTGAWPVCGK